MWQYHLFLYVILLEIVYFGRYVYLCRKHRTTHHLAFVMAIACVSILSVEWVRVFLINIEMAEAQHRDLLVWALEHLPFGGYWYGRIMEKVRKSKNTTPTSTRRSGRSVSGAA